MRDIHFLQDLNQKAIQCSEDIRKLEFQMICILQEIDAHKVYSFIGYPSLYSYCLRVLKFSEHRAYNFIAVARKAKTFDKLQFALESGKITVSKARRIAAVINHSNIDEWIEMASKLPQKHLEKAVASQNPRAVFQESIRYLNNEVLELRTCISEKTYKKLLRVKQLISQKTSNTATVEDALDEMCDLYIKANDPVQRAQRSFERKQRKQDKKNKVSKSELGARRVPIPAVTVHEVHLRDQGRCQAKEPDGKQCESQNWIDIHHIKHIKDGGTNDAWNLMTLCRSHHQMEHSDDLHS